MKAFVLLFAGLVLVSCSGGGGDDKDAGATDLTADSDRDTSVDVAIDPHGETPTYPSDSEPEFVDVPEEIVEEPGVSAGNFFVLTNDEWDGGSDPMFPSSVDYSQTIQGEVYHFRPWVRFRMPHPGTVKRMFVYTAGAPGTVSVRLSTGYPGGHYPCLDEETGDDPYSIGPAFRMDVSEEPGWRVFDLSEAGHQVGGYDEFFVIFDQDKGARVGLSYPAQTQPRDYSIFGGLIADVPGDGVGCFPTMSTFTDNEEAPLIWLVRVEIEAAQALEQRVFSLPDDGPSLGGHAAFGDFDNDGDEDLLSGGKLWENDGTGAFTDVTVDAGLSGLGGETVWGDYDNDGFRDILSVGGHARLFHNDGSGGFTEVTESSGIEINANSQGVAWVDFDADGLLDFFAASYGTPEDSEIATRDYLFHNNGDGTFTDVTGASGMPLASPGGYHGRGVCVADYDTDGDPDIYVGNYRLDPNQLWMNLGGGGGFEDVAPQAGVNGNWEFGSYGHTIGPSFGDIDTDGLFDLVVPNLAHPRFIGFSDPTTVYINNGDGTFQGFEPPDKGIAYDETHSGSVLFDMDNDGDLDLFLTSVYEGRRSYLYLNDGTGSFSDATYAAGILHLNGWGCAAADVDGDGDVDLVAHGLYLNGREEGDQYLKVRLTGGAVLDKHEGLSNRDAIGAWVEAEIDGLKLVRQVEGGKGTGCQNSLGVHFGLGDKQKVDALTVHWPSGRVTELDDIQAGQTLELIEPLD